MYFIFGTYFLNVKKGQGVRENFDNFRKNKSLFEMK